MNIPISPIPSLPGVYFFKDTQGNILYIGKAKSLHNRVKSYFQKNKSDWKIKYLINSYYKIDFIVTKNETEASLLEAELIHQYKPKFNVLLKNGNPFIYILITKSTIANIMLVRNKKQKGIYIGPFLQKQAARSVYHFIMRRFNLYKCNKKIENGCLDYHIGNCAGSCKTNFDVQSYIFRTKLAIDALQNNHEAFTQKINQQITFFSQKLEFERAQKLQQYLTDLTIIFDTIKTNFNPKKFHTDIFIATCDAPSFSDKAHDIAHELQKLTASPFPIYSLDCFDVSHFQGRQMVGACIRFSYGIPIKHKFRKFNIKTITKQNDYAALAEIVTRRYNNLLLPDLIVIDGGKGQLHTIQKILPKATIVSIAKREERLFCNAYKEGIPLDIKTPLGKLLIALRDYTHHFAISYHRLKKKKEII